MFWLVGGGGWCVQTTGAIVHNFRHVNACVYYSILLLDLFCEEVKSVSPAGGCSPDLFQGF